MNNIITYRIFYWVPNTLSGERIAIGLCLFDEAKNRLATHWVNQKELLRLQNVFRHTHRGDSRNLLNMLHEVKENWRSKAYHPSFWNYIERYWNGILQISDSKKVYYEGNAADFDRKSEMLKSQFLPLSAPIPEKRAHHTKIITRNFEQWVKEKNLEKRVTLGAEIPEHGKYRLLKSIYLDLGAFNGNMTGSTGIDFSLTQKTLIEKVHSYFEGFQSIKKIDGGGNFSFVIHQNGKPYEVVERQEAQFYDDFRYRCDELSIDVLTLDEIEDFVGSLSEKPYLRPLEVDKFV